MHGVIHRKYYLFEYRNHRSVLCYSVSFYIGNIIFSQAFRFSLLLATLAGSQYLLKND